MKNAFFLAVGLIIIFGSILIFLQRPFTKENQLQTIEIDGETLEVEVVITPEARAQGLSGREFLPEDTGMLFIFEDSAFHGIWMKEMLFSIDIVWIDEKMRVVGMEKRVLPETFPLIFYPPSPTQYILELPAGLANNLSLEIGDIINFETQIVTNQ